MWLTTSWDDGHPLDLRLAELMNRHGIAGTFYYPQRNVEGLPVMRGDELRRLDGDLFEVGSHTHDHTYANRTDAQQWAQQVRRGKAALEQTLGHAVDGFCYPGGELEPDSKAIVAAAGFTYARTTRNFFGHPGNEPLLMPTSLQFYPHSRSVLLRNYVRHGDWARRARLAHAALRGATLRGRLEALLDAQHGDDTVVHVWGHSWEIEAQGLWAQLADFFACVAERVPKARRLTNAGVARRTWPR